MDNAKAQLVEKLQSATNILVTVSRNPTVDQLAACVGLTLLLNKFGKHATAVFSGEVPSTLEFLQPEQTLEKTTDSLRDFIIALDKSKADKLRYKVEDEMVRIFITPYRVSLTANDLEFSQGDFNVDVVIALGVSAQEDFDAAITAHGRILHDAVVSSIATSGHTSLGSINWSQPTASSLSEVIVGLARSLGENLIDPQVATALLTGIVSETDRFSNEKTTPQTMSVSAELMAAGANQQLVATKLDEPEQPIAAPRPLATPAEADSAAGSDTLLPAPTTADGTLEIDHDSIEAVLEDLRTSGEPASLTPAAPEHPAYANSELPVPEAPPVPVAPQSDPAAPSNKQSRLIVEPPTLGGRLTANSQPESFDPPNDVLGIPSEPQPALLNRLPDAQPADTSPAYTPPRDAPSPTDFTPPPPAWTPATQDSSGQPNNISNVDTSKTLSEIENAVHLAEGEHLDNARDEVERALNSQPVAPEPVQSLGAQPLGDRLHPTDDVAAAVAEASAPAPAFADLLQQVIPPAPAGSTLPLSPVTQAPVAQPTVTDPNAPPPVPPPIPFNFGTPQQ